MSPLLPHHGVIASHSWLDVMASRIPSVTSRVLVGSIGLFVGHRRHGDLLGAAHVVGVAVRVDAVSMAIRHVATHSADAHAARTRASKLLLELRCKRRKCVKFESFGNPQIDPEDPDLFSFANLEKAVLGLGSTTPKHPHRKIGICVHMQDRKIYVHSPRRLRSAHFSPSSTNQHTCAEWLKNARNLQTGTYTAHVHKKTN